MATDLCSNCRVRLLEYSSKSSDAEGLWRFNIYLQTPNNFKCALVLAEQQAAVQVKCLKGQERSENARGKKNLGAQTAGAVCRTIPARFQLQEGLESSKLRRRPAGRRQLQEALHNSGPAAAGALDLGR